MIWFNRVLWHINHCGLFNAKSSLFLCIKYIWFGPNGFYGISTIVGYLMPNSFYAFLSLRVFGLLSSSLLLISTTFRPICPPAIFRCLLSKFLTRSLLIFIIKGFRTTVFIFIIISTAFWPVCPRGFLQVFVELGNLHGTSNYVL